MPDIRTLKADLAIIGAGSGGLSAAAGAAMLGLKVVLFEKHEMGGDCLNYGCVPSKALLSAARAAQAVRDAASYGVSAPAPAIDWQAVRQHIRRAIETIAPVDSQERFEGLGVTVIREEARFIDRQTVASASTRVRARRIIIATGSTAFVPPIPGLADVPFVTNETIFNLPALPQHLIILGAGPIGLEMAQAFVRLGSRVTVIERAAALPRADRAHARLAVEALKAEGVLLLEGHNAVRVSGEAGRLSVTAEGPAGAVEIVASDLLVAVGRRAVLKGLDLEAGGVAFDERGVIVGDNLRSRTNPRVWALGDAAGREQFTHIAGWHASVFVRRALFKQATLASSLPVPAVTYTSPEVAQLGLTEAEARTKYKNGVSTASFPFHDNDRAIAEGKTLGEAKLILHRGRLVGASIVGEGAGEIIQLVSVAMSNRLRLTALTNFISPYPTRAEVVKRAASAHFAPTVFGPAARRLVAVLQRIP